MMGNVNMVDYYKLAAISQNLNRFIREAAIAKSQVISSIPSAIFSDKNIGANIDVFA
jgi:hypothetical protein